MIEALVLNSIDYKETSKILNLYTPEGHRSVIANGVKKMKSKYRYLAQNGTHIKLDLGDRKLPSLKDAELIENYEYIKQDVLNYTYMNHILELIRHTISDDLNHQKMFQFLQKIFVLMNDGYDPEVLTFIFELKLLYFIGYGLNFKQCSICNDNEELVFHISSGGLVCKKHLMFNQHYYERDIYNQLQTLYYIDISNVEIPSITESDKAIIRHIIDLGIDEFISFKTKSREILKQLKKY